jgi:hypothetical protein
VAKRPKANRPSGVTIEKHDENIFVVDITTDDRADWEQWFMACGDDHFDAKHCDRRLIKHHLDQLEERNALAFNAGDMFDVMGGKWDKRSLPSDLREEYQAHPNYLQIVPRSAGKFYAPYVHRFIACGTGNHEASILKKHQVDLMSEFDEAVRRENGGTINPAGYSYTIVVLIRHRNTVHRRVISVHHGHGGGGMMTFGTLSVRREQSSDPDADVMVWGHIHERWSLETAKKRLIQKHGRFRHRLDPVHHVRVGAMKDEYRDRGGGWHVERGGPPKPLGWYWIRFSITRKTKTNDDGHVSDRAGVEIQTMQVV